MTTISWYPYLSVTYNDFRICDDNGDALPLPLVERIGRCKMMRMINRDEACEIGYEWSCPMLTLHSTCKYTIRLSHDRNELDLHPDLDFRSLGRQAKRFY